MLNQLVKCSNGGWQCPTTHPPCFFFVGGGSGVLWFRTYKAYKYSLNIPIGIFYSRCSYTPDARTQDTAIWLSPAEGALGATPSNICLVVVVGGLGL